MRKLITKFVDFIKESNDVSKPEISFEEKFDERAPKKLHKSFNVNYLINKSNGEFIEIEGILTDRKSGPEFEPSYFTNTESEMYYDENSENIEEEIINSFENQK